ncbi:MAG: hypothetical protein HY316_10580 [Acidobacteria bacterium]|nr:hypothetical protein [Acidobacteriota bacterium]
MPATLCAICHKRKPKRQCPGIHGAICPQCCGTEREVSVDCPLDCTYLRESRRHDAEKLTALPEMPYKDVEVPDRFLHEQEQMIGAISVRLLRHHIENPRVTDQEILEGLEKLIQTYQTQQSGIYYDSLPEGGPAVGVYREIKTFFEEIEKQAHQQGTIAPGFTAIKEGDVIRALVFLYRLATVHFNHRPRGRAFLSFLRETFPLAIAAPREESRLIIP